LQCDATVVVGLGIIGLDRQRTRITIQRFLIAFELAQGIATVVVRLGIIGLDRERTSITVQRFLKAFQALEHIAVIAVCRGVTWICSNNASQQVCCFFCAPRLRCDDAQQVQRVKVFSSRCERLSTQALRLGPFATGICHCRLLHSLRQSNRCAIAMGAGSSLLRWLLLHDPVLVGCVHRECQARWVGGTQLCRFTGIRGSIQKVGFRSFCIGK
jgi:hypothetical protein